MANKRVVIINDGKDSLGELEAILGASGYDSVVVNDALAAVDVVVRNNPDVVLLELKMPRKNGFEIAGEINHALETRRIPIIAMSDFFKGEFGFLLELCGINRHVTKPVKPLDVLWAINSVID